jgi:hypothetical protein
MMNSPESQSGILLREEPEAPEPTVKHYALLDEVARQPERPPRKRSVAPITVITVTVIMVLIGLLAGWIGGKSLTGAFQTKPAADIPLQDNAVPPSQPQPNPHSSANVAVPGSKSVQPRESQQPQQRVDESQPQREANADEGKEQKEKEDHAIEVPTKEQSTKEIGEKTMEKILKENDKIKRGKHLKDNKNDE